jgi:SAM-dependent methyltransferase
MAEVLEATGFPIGQAGSVLDFGCSSGRLVRALHAAYGDVAFAGCDPIEDAIAWAREHVPGVELRVTGREPPLPYGDGEFGAVLALSVWSHFGEEAAGRWFAEMHRIVAPGGRLAVSLQGFSALRRLAGAGAWELRDLQDAGRGLYRRGFYYRDVFGADGDWGLSNEQWGWAFISPEWVQTQLCPRWAVLLFRPGYLDDFQDLLVLERRPSRSVAS